MVIVISPNALPVLVALIPRDPYPVTVPVEVIDSAPVPLLVASMAILPPLTLKASIVRSVLLAEFYAIIPCEPPEMLPVALIDSAPVPLLITLMPLMPPSASATEIVKSVPVEKFSPKTP